MRRIHDTRFTITATLQSVSNAGVESVFIGRQVIRLPRTMVDLSTSLSPVAFKQADVFAVDILVIVVRTSTQELKILGTIGYD